MRYTVYSGKSPVYTQWTFTTQGLVNGRNMDQCMTKHFSALVSRHLSDNNTIYNAVDMNAHIRRVLIDYRIQRPEKNAPEISSKGNVG